MKTIVRPGLRRGLALLMAVVLCAAMLPAAAMAADSTVVDTAEDLVDATDGLTSLREAVTGANSGQIISFSADLKGKDIVLKSAIEVETKVSIRLNNQTITASYDPETGSDDPLAVFVVGAGGDLTLNGQGTIKPASAASGQPSSPTRCAVYVKGSGAALTVKGDIAVTSESSDASVYLIGLSSGTSLTLSGAKNISGGAFGVKALAGATGYTINIDMTGAISSGIALGLTEPGSVSIVNATLRGTTQAISVAAGSMTLGQMAAAGTGITANGAPATADQLGTGPQGNVTEYIFAPAPATPSPTPTAPPSEEPSASPSESPSASPSESPSASPSESPSASPSESPSTSPSETPTASPSETPTASPSESPSASPSESPSASPSESPSASPSESPSASPTTLPTVQNLAWSGTKAVWSSVPDAKKYEVQLYYNGTDAEHALGSTVIVNNTTSWDFASSMTQDGKYYYNVRAVAGSVTGEWSAFSRAYTRDNTPPKITSRAPVRLSASSARFYFTSSEAGNYYFIHTVTGGSTPTADDIINSQDNIHNACSSSEQTITLTGIGDEKARDIYLVVVDAAGNISAPYKISIPEYVAPTPSPTPTPTRRPIVTNTPDPVMYKVTLPTGTGYVLSAYGSSSPVAAGGSFSFSLTIYNGYTKGSGFAVKANGVTLSSSNNIYTITNINADQTVTVTGVTTAWPSTSTGTTTTTTTVSVPSITTTLLPSAAVGQAYSQQMTATGGTPITWSYSGSLPVGMSLSSAGLLSGTPAAEGSYRFTLKASNASGSAIRQLTLIVTGTEYSVTDGANANWVQGSEDGLTFTGSGSNSYTVQIDGSTVAEDVLTRSSEDGSVTISPDFLSTLSAGSHTLTLVYSDGNAKAKFNVRSRTSVIPPNVTAQPQNLEVEAGKDATFTVTASGTAPLSCQWQIDRGDGSGWTDIEGATGASYTLDNVTAEDSGLLFRCRISNAAGETESSSAILTVRDALGTVTAQESAAVRTSNIGRIILITALCLGLAAVGVGAWWFIRRRNEYDDFDDVDEEE